MPAEAQIETAEPTTPALDDLWTSDSQRTEALQAETPEPESEPQPEPIAATPEPAEAIAQPDKGKTRGKPRNDPQARVQQATAQAAAAKEEARLAREEAARLQRELEAARRPSAPPTTPTPQPSAPPAEKFPDYATWEAAHSGESFEDYLDARNDWRVEQREQAQERHRRVVQFTAGISEARQEYPDYDVIVSKDLPLSDAMKEAILSSPLGPKIAYALGTHPDECIQLANDSARAGVDAVPVVRRYLESLVTAGAVARPDSASAVRPSSAKPPINRVGGSASATPADPDDLEFGPEFIRLENAREKKRQEARRW